MYVRPTGCQGEFVTTGPSRSREKSTMSSGRNVSVHGSVAQAARVVVESLEARKMLCTNPHALASHAAAALASGEHVAVAINAGGASVTDSAGQLWSADFGSTGGAASLGMFPVRDTTDDALFSNHR